VDFECVVESPDVASIYEIPLRFREQASIAWCASDCASTTKEPELGPWKQMARPS
jgi:CTP synthase (UTP-ammonia lyase)